MSQPQNVVPFKSNIPSLHMDEGELIAVMQSSVYPGAKLESIKLAIGYCRAAGLDPLQKPVHIVPMDAKTGKKDGEGKDIYEKRDVIMPGIGLYRIQASRSNEYAGMTAPEFGPEKTVKLGKDSKDYTYPEWCKVTVRRVVNGQTVEFTAIEYWIENYATKSKWDTEPNAMWKKRPRGQLAKCAEAQALRKAFPEFGAQPTADEMEGKVIDGDEVVIEAPRVEGPKPKSAPPAGNDETTAVTRDAPAVGAESGKVEGLSDGAKATLKRTMERYGRTEADLITAGFPSLDTMPFSRFNEVMAHLKANPAAT